MSLGLLTFRMDCKCCSIDRFISDHDIAVFVYENQVGNTDLREVLRERVEPEVVCENGISD